MWTGSRTSRSGRAGKFRGTAGQLEQLEVHRSDSTQVTITGPDGATIYYTQDGSTPTSSSSQYSSAITLSATATIKAIAIKDGVSSSVAEKTFTKSE